MRTVVLEVQPVREALREASHAMKAGRAEREAHIGFASPELLWKVLTAKRWELLKAMTGAGPGAQPRFASTFTSGNPISRSTK